MGYRLHYATTYNVKLGGGYFNHKNEAINRLLVEECDAWYDGEEVESAEKLEVERSRLADLVHEIEENSEMYDKWIADHGWDYDHRDLISIFNEMIEKSDPEHNYIILSWY